MEKIKELIDDVGLPAVLRSLNNGSRERLEEEMASAGQSLTRGMTMVACRGYYCVGNYLEGIAYGPFSGGSWLALTMHTTAGHIRVIMSWIHHNVQECDYPSEDCTGGRCDIDDPDHDCGDGWCECDCRRCSPMGSDWCLTHEEYH